MDRLTAEVRSFFDEAAEFGLGRMGLSLPIHGRHCVRAHFSITSDLNDREWRSLRQRYMRDFQVLALHMHEVILLLEGHETEPSSLSPREHEYLQWIAEGKTVWECSAILRRSMHTVRCYLESARHKLGATSNTHAVAKAVKADLLSPSRKTRQSAGFLPFPVPSARIHDCRRADRSARVLRC